MVYIQRLRAGVTVVSGLEEPESCGQLSHVFILMVAKCTTGLDVVFFSSCAVLLHSTHMTCKFPIVDCNFRCGVSARTTHHLEIEGTTLRLTYVQLDTPPNSSWLITGAPGKSTGIPAHLVMLFLLCLPTAPPPSVFLCLPIVLDRTNQ